MDEHVVDAPRRDELWLIKAFLRINDSAKRQLVLELAERLADRAASGNADTALASTEASRDEGSRGLRSGNE